jgi:hypothetical protein
MLRDQGHAARRDADAFRDGLKGGLRLRNLSANAPPRRRRRIESFLVFVELFLECRKRGLSTSIDILLEMAISVRALPQCKFILGELDVGAQSEDFEHNVAHILPEVIRQAPIRAAAAVREKQFSIARTQPVHGIYKFFRPCLPRGYRKPQLLFGRMATVDAPIDEIAEGNARMVIACALSPSYVPHFPLEIV